jgi:CO/xanthine dehydrogenase Mo-binding subunit
MSASNGVYFVGHATREAARALLRFGLYPAAIALWGRAGGAAVSAQDIASATVPCLPPDTRRCRSTGWRWPRTKWA